MSNISLNSENIPLNQIKIDLKGKNNGSCSTTIKQGPPEEYYSHTYFFPGGMAIGVPITHKTKSLPKK